MENIKILPMTNLLKDGENAPENELSVKCNVCGRNFHTDGEQAASGLFTGFVCEECKPTYEEQQAATATDKNTEASSTISAALGK